MDGKSGNDHKRNPVIIIRPLRVSVDRIMKYEPSIWPRSPWVLRSSVDRAPLRCLGGHRFHFCRRLRFFSLSHVRDMMLISSTQDKHIKPRIKHADLAISYTSRVFLCPYLCPHVCFVRSGRCSSGTYQSTKSSEVGIIVIFIIIVMIVTIIVMYCVFFLWFCYVLVCSLFIVVKNGLTVLKRWPAVVVQRDLSTQRFVLFWVLFSSAFFSQGRKIRILCSIWWVIS